MMDTLLFFVHYALLLLFGIVLSAKFSGVTLSRRTFGILLVLFSICAIFQFLVFTSAGEAWTWKLYPLITHLPLLLTLIFVFHKRFLTALAAVASAYFCCQPAKWFGLLITELTGNTAAALLTRIAVLLLVGMLAIRFLSVYIAKIYNKDSRSIALFSSVPLIYYLFDYIAGVYTDFWVTNNRIASEFLSLFLCVVFMIFCVVYYMEHEQKADAERKEQIVRIAVEQQSREIADMKQRELETRLIRHDLRLLLDNLALSIEQEDRNGSLRMISGFVKQIQPSVLHRYCENDTINYVLSNYESKCKMQNVEVLFTVEVQSIPVDEAILAPILSNALDNALNAQKDLPQAKRQIKLMLKNADGKLLLSVRNPYHKRPTFVDGMPVSGKSGHGYGTQSIRYLTERAGGKCQFSLQDDMFLLRVVL